MSKSISRTHILVAGIALGALTVFASACGGSDDSQPSAGPVDEATFQSGLVAEQCSRIGLCCTAASQPFEEAKCESQLRDLFPNADGAGGGGAGGAAAGLAVTYDANAAAKCLEQVKALPKTCGALLPTGTVDAPSGALHLIDPCQSVYVGTKAVGEGCTSSLECAPNDKHFAYCNPSSHQCEEVVAVIKGTCGESDGKLYVCIPQGGDGIHVAACDGTQCMGLAHEGDKCITQFTDTKCDEGLTCQSTSGGVDGTCVGFPKAGEACMSGQCAEGAYCDGTNCVAQKADGAACTGGNECAAPNQCTSGTCQAPAAQLCTAGH
jgi:hypothetical protein